MDVPFQTPIWFIIVLATAANVLQLMSGSRTFAVPRFLEWITATVAVAWIGLVIIPSLSAGRGTPGIGGYYRFTSAVIPLLCLAVPSS